MSAAPYPHPTSEAASAVMRGNRSRDTKPELALRSALHRCGLRFRKDYSIELPGRRVRADVAFPARRVAVFLDGCFWHRCPEHGNVPSANSAYWEPKLGRNVERDRAVNEALSEVGWRVVRLWEHVELSDAVDEVRRVVASTLDSPGRRRRT